VVTPPGTAARGSCTFDVRSRRACGKLHRVGATRLTPSRHRAPGHIALQQWL
jgi:hypothetical protein